MTRGTSDPPISYFPHPARRRFFNLRYNFYMVCAYAANKKE